MRYDSKYIHDEMSAIQQAWDEKWKSEWKPILEIQKELTKSYFKILGYELFEHPKFYIKDDSRGIIIADMEAEPYMKTPTVISIKYHAPSIMEIAETYPFMYQHTTVFKMNFDYYLKRDEQALVDLRKEYDLVFEEFCTVRKKLQMKQQEVQDILKRIDVEIEKIAKEKGLVWGKWLF